MRANQQEGDEHRLEEELKTGEDKHRIHDVRGQDYDADIDQIVGHKNCSQQFIDISTQREDLLVARIARCSHLLLCGG